MATIPFPAFEPDKARFNIGSLPNTVNAIPTADGWGPLNDKYQIGSVYEYLTDESGNRLMDESGNLLVAGAGGLPYGSSNLPSTCLGCFAARKSDGSERIFAGTATKLYEFNKGTAAWDDVTRLVGGNYATTGRWSFVRFGTYVYAANGVDTEQRIDLEAGTNFVANSTAPICKYIAVVGDFLFRGNKVGYPYQIQWSSINDPTANTATVNMSDYQDIPTGDEVMGIVPLSNGAHVWMRSALHGMSFALNSEYVFSRTQMTEMRGTSAPYSIGVIAQDDYVIYCDDGFWRYSGGSFNPIGSGRVNDWFLTESDQEDRDNIVAMADPERNIVWWSYADANGTRKLLGYHYIFDRWCTANVPLLASMRARTFSYVVGGVPVFETDLLRFVAIDSSGYLVYLVGDNLAATIETNEIQLDPSSRGFVNGGRLQGDPTDFTVTLKTADYMGGSLTARSAVTPSSRTKSLSLRGDGRVHKFTLSVPAAATWTTVGALEINAVPGGKS